MARPTAPGQRVRLTGQFLRSTGQFTGQDAHSTWTVLSLDSFACSLGTTTFVEVDERSCDMPDRNRRINAANLYVVGTLDHRNA
jgi:hypothetical protein